MEPIKGRHTNSETIKNRKGSSRDVYKITKKGKYFLITILYAYNSKIGEKQEPESSDIEQYLGKK